MPLYLSHVLWSSDKEDVIKMAFDLIVHVF